MGVELTKMVWAKTYSAIMHRTSMHHLLMPIITLYNDTTCMHWSPCNSFLLLSVLFRA